MSSQQQALEPLCQCPCSPCHVCFLQEIRAYLREHGKLFAEANVADAKMQKKVRDAQLAQYNYILVVGEAEKAGRSVNVRTRDNVVHGTMTLQDFCTKVAAERDSRSLESCFKGEGQADGHGKAAAADGAAQQ